MKQKKSKLSKNFIEQLILKIYEENSYKYITKLDSDKIFSMIMHHNNINLQFILFLKDQQIIS